MSPHRETQRHSFGVANCLFGMPESPRCDRPLRKRSCSPSFSSPVLSQISVSGPLSRRAISPYKETQLQSSGVAKCLFRGSESLLRKGSRSPPISPNKVSRRAMSPHEETQLHSSGVAKSLDEFSHRNPSGRKGSCSPTLSPRTVSRRALSPHEETQLHSSGVAESLLEASKSSPRNGSRSPHLSPMVVSKRALSPDEETQASTSLRGVPWAALETSIPCALQQPSLMNSHVWSSAEALKSVHDMKLRRHAGVQPGFFGPPLGKRFPTKARAAGKIPGLRRSCSPAYASAVYASAHQRSPSPTVPKLRDMPANDSQPDTEGHAVPQNEPGDVVPQTEPGTFVPPLQFSNSVNRVGIQARGAQFEPGTFGPPLQLSEARCCNLRTREDGGRRRRRSSSGRQKN